MGTISILLLVHILMDNKLGALEELTSSTAVLTVSPSDLI